MIRYRHAIGCLFSLSIALSGHNLAAQSLRCALKDMPTSYGGGVGEVRSEGIELATRSRGKVLFRSQQPQSIVEITLVVDYLDDHEKRLFTIIYHDGVGDLKRGSIEGRSFALQVPGMREKLSAGTDLELAGSDSVTTNVCPASARVTMTNFTFENGRTDSFQLPDWHLDPQLEYGGHVSYSADYLVVDRGLVPKKTEFLARAGITSDGTLRDLTFLDSKAKGLEKPLRSSMSRWRFLAAIDNGSPVNSSVLLLFRFQPTYRAEPPGAWVGPGRSFAIVDFVPQDATTNRWSILYGDLPVLSRPPIR